jgi:hypothetical protein
MPAFLKHYTQPAFLICVLLLAGAAAGMPSAMKYLGVILAKEPLPIEKSLDLLDEHGLGTYKVVAKTAIDNREVLKSLGTEDYIQWVLEDTEAEPDSKARYCTLFITYYDLPDRVPHVPEECYVGGGYRRVSSDTMNLSVVKDGTPAVIPGRYVVFAGTSKEGLGLESKFPVCYLLNVNRKYEADRYGARRTLGKNFRKYSYFSKVEWMFFGMEFGSKVYPEKADTIRASERLLAVILPILEQEHWPRELTGHQKEQESGVEDSE